MMKNVKKYVLFLSALLFIGALLGCPIFIMPYENKLQPPTGVTIEASAFNENTVTIKWTDNGAANYWIYYNTTNNTTTATLITKEPTSGVVGCDIILPANGIYYFWIKAAAGPNDTDPTSTFSAVALFELTDALTPPSNVIAEASTTTNTITVTWTDNGAANYWIYYNTTNDTTTATLATDSVPSGTTSYTIPFTTNGTYYFWVKAATKHNGTTSVSDFSLPASCTFTYQQVLSPPTNVKVETSTIKNAVKVTWTDNEAPWYWVYRNTENNTATATLVGHYDTSGVYGCNIPISADGTYFFWVRAADGFENTAKKSDFSTPASFPAPADVTAVVSSTPNSIKVTWTDNGATNYWIYYNTTYDTTTATLVTQSASSGASGYDIPFTTNGTYYFWVKSATKHDDITLLSDFSIPASCDFTYTLPAPTNVTVETSSTPNKVKVKWNDNGAAYYWIYYSTTNDTSTAFRATKFALSGSTGYDISLSTTGTYYFWVKAANGTSDTDATSNFSNPSQPFYFMYKK